MCCYSKIKSGIWSLLSRPPSHSPFPCILSHVALCVIRLAEQPLFNSIYWKYQNKQTYSTLCFIMIFDVKHKQFMKESISKLFKSNLLGILYWKRWTEIRMTNFLKSSEFKITSSTVTIVYQSGIVGFSVSGFNSVLSAKDCFLEI